MKTKLICHDCGTQLQRDNSKINLGVEWSKDVCSRCNRIKAVTDAKNFGLEGK